MLADRRTKTFFAMLAFTMVFAGATILAAHHSFAIFDTAKRVTLTGSVTSFEWTNPHAYIEVDVTENGAIKHWSVELGSPSILMQGGWKFKDIKAGDKVTVTLNPLRNGNAGGLLIEVKLPDGRTLGNGPGRGPTAPAAATPTTR